MTSNITISGFLVLFPQILVNLLSETLSLGENILEFREKMLEFRWKIWYFVAKSWKILRWNFFSTKVTKGPSEPSVTLGSRSPKNIKYWLLESIGDPWNQLWHFWARSNILLTGRAYLACKDLLLLAIGRAQAMRKYVPCCTNPNLDVEVEDLGQ